MTYKLAIGVFCVSPLFANTGFFAERFVHRPVPDLQNVEVQVAPGTNADLSFTLALTDTQALVLPTVFGNNANPWLGKALLADQSYGLEHLRNAHITTLRMPGGNWSNNWLWDGVSHWNYKNNYLDSVYSAPTKSWPLSSSQQIALAQSIASEPQICVNYALARYINSATPVNDAAHYAAEWVRKVNDTLGLGVRYWEVGNENYGPWQTGWLVNGDTLDGDEYGRDFRVFADSMKSADPTIKIGAVVVERDNGNKSGGYRYWMKKMLPEIQDKADYLAYHEYFTWASDINTVTTDQVLAGLDLIRLAKDSIEAMVERYTDKPADYFPIAFTEYNVRAGMKDNQFVSAVFIAMALGEFMRNGIGLANLWDIVNGYNATTGDQGMLSVDDPNSKDYTPHPSFYVFYLYQKMFGDVLLGSSPLVQNGVRLYVSRFATGELSLMLVNQTATPHTVGIDLGAFMSDGYAYGYTLQAQGPTATLLSMNGRTGATDFGPVNYASIPLWKQTLGAATRFASPAWSVQSILLTTSAPSPLKSRVRISPENERPLHGLHDLLGRLRSSRLR